MENRYICQDVSFKWIEWKVKSILKEDRYTAGRGITHLCTSCKKVGDDKEYWNHIEAHIREHPQAELTHFIIFQLPVMIALSLYSKII